MPAVAWFTVVVAAIIIAAAALGLVRVVLHLRAVARSLDGVVAGVRAVEERTSPVPVVLPSVNASLAPVRDFCERI